MMVQRRGRQFTDVALESGDCHVVCHRNVLAAASPYFHTLFTSGLPDSTSATVRLNVKPVTPRLVVDYLYSANVNITANNAQSVVEASEHLLIDALKAACDQFLSE